MRKTSSKYAFKAVLLTITIALFSCVSDKKENGDDQELYVQISRENPAYFQLSDGSPYIPVGINLISPPGRQSNNPDSSLYDYGQWMKKLSENGGNYIRVWLSSPFWDIEDQKAGYYSEEKAGRIDTLIKMAERYNLKIKMTLEHFRSLTEEENPQPWAVKSVYHSSKGGPLDSIRQYITTQEGQKLFLDKVGFYNSRYGSQPVFFGWELWNEMNAMKGPEDSLFFMWNERMLKEVKKRFPENLVMQSLGSFDTDGVRSLYMTMMSLPGNEVAQVHRYLDPGAPLDLCRMPMDIICSSSVEEILSYKYGKPVILAETGAVESRHSGPSRFYASDTAGMLLHDILFAPFFSGSAGAGMSWHWDSYVDKNNLWYHFARFSESVKGIDPAKEKFTVSKYEKEGLRIYRLSGNSTVLLWIRDKSNTWESELRDHQPPGIISGISLPTEIAGLSSKAKKIEIYDPWTNKRTNAVAEQSAIALPSFRRSIVIRIIK